MLPIFPFPADYGSGRVRPASTPLAQPHYDGLKAGKLLLQHCTDCGRVRLTFGPRCPWCGGGAARWLPASGRACLHSWTRYHRAYLEEFEGLLPYVVIAAQLAEGPVVFGRLRGASAVPASGAPLWAVVERWRDGFCGLAFQMEAAL